MKSGKLLLRLPKSLHAQLDQQAGAEGISLNQYLVASLSLIMAKSSLGQKVIPQDRLEAIAADEFCDGSCPSPDSKAGVCKVCDAIFAARETLADRKYKAEAILLQELLEDARNTNRSLNRRAQKWERRAVQGIVPRLAQWLMLYYKRKFSEAEAELELLRSEAKENARIIGMSGSVEASLRAEIETLKRDKDAAWRQANVAHQHTRCCVCGIDKHTPVRCDDLGGYICGGCLEKAYFEEQERAETAEAKQEGALGKLHSIAGTVNFFASVIKSGEPWTPECQKALEKVKELAFGDGK